MYRDQDGDWGPATTHDIIMMIIFVIPACAFLGYLILKWWL